MLPRPGVKRFLLVTLGITGLYLGLNALWLAATPALASLFDARAAAGWEREAAAVTAAAREADNRLPPETRVAAYRLGFHVGYCSNVLGSFALSGADAQAKARAILADRIAATQDLARSLGVGAIAFLPVSNADDFGYVNDRLEADELGLAARLERATSRRHRHLLMLGMHVGVAAGLADVTGGEAQNPLRPYIGRHATLARVPSAAWEPVARVPDGATPDARLAAYQAALTALDAAVARLPPLR
jgi:hypothetical protein